MGLVIVMAFAAGHLSATKKYIPPPTPLHQEISVIEFQSIVGDSLQGNISGPARIVWEGVNVIEKEGAFSLPLGQIKNELDLALIELPYTANAKTKKFYPSDSYPARGTEVRYRRFFATKNEAIAAGFEASKLVK